MKYIIKCFLWQKISKKNIYAKDFFSENFNARVCTQQPLRTLIGQFLKVSFIPSYRISIIPVFVWSFFDKVPSQVSVIILNGTSETPKRNKNLSSHQFSLYRCLCRVKIREWSVQWSVECKVCARKAQWKLKGNVELNVQREERIQIVEYPVMVIRCAVGSAQFLLHRGSSTEKFTQGIF